MSRIMVTSHFLMLSPPRVPFVDAKTGTVRIANPFIGRDDAKHDYALTNLNTLVLSGKDCKTVVTSHPGLPSGAY